MSGTVIWPAGLIKTRRCSHLHVSGRRCAFMVAKKPGKANCGLHEPKCRECDAMMRAFTPPKGWSP